LVKGFRDPSEWAIIVENFKIRNLNFQVLTRKDDGNGLERNIKCLELSDEEAESVGLMG
jgi:hypothetical protein